MEKLDGKRVSEEAKFKRVCFFDAEYVILMQNGKFKK